MTHTVDLMALTPTEAEAARFAHITAIRILPPSQFIRAETAAQGDTIYRWSGRVLISPDHEHVFIQPASDGTPEDMKRLQSFAKSIVHGSWIGFKRYFKKTKPIAALDDLLGYSLPYGFPVGSVEVCEEPGCVEDAHELFGNDRPIHVLDTITRKTKEGVILHQVGAVMDPEEDDGTERLPRNRWHLTVTATEDIVMNAAEAASFASDLMWMTAEVNKLNQALTESEASRISNAGSDVSRVSNARSDRAA